MGQEAPQAGASAKLSKRSGPEPADAMVRLFMLPETCSSLLSESIRIATGQGWLTAPPGARSARKSIFRNLGPDGVARLNRCLSFKRSVRTEPADALVQEIHRDGVNHSGFAQYFDGVAQLVTDESMSSPSALRMSTFTTRIRFAAACVTVSTQDFTPWRPQRPSST